MWNKKNCSDLINLDICVCITDVYIQITRNIGKQISQILLLFTDNAQNLNIFLLVPNPEVLLGKEQDEEVFFAQRKITAGAHETLI